MSDQRHGWDAENRENPKTPAGTDVPDQEAAGLWPEDEEDAAAGAFEPERPKPQSLIPGGDAPPDEPDKPAAFNFSDPPTQDELKAFAQWDPDIRAKVSEKFEDLVRDRAERTAMRALYDALDPDLPPLPREEAPASRHETMLSLGQLIADVQEAVAYLLEYGGNRNNDSGRRLNALASVTRVGHPAAALGRTIDVLCRPNRAPRPKGPRT
jgi:hypothetical protein